MFRLILLALTIFASLLNIGCGKKSEVCSIAESAEAKILSAWEQGGLKSEVDKKGLEWKAGIESTRSDKRGAVEAANSFVKWFEAMDSVESRQAEQLSKQNERMIKGEYTPEKPQDIFKAMLGNPDGLTNEQRAKSYAPRIAENIKKIEAHKKASEAAKDAAQKLRKLVS